MTLANPRAVFSYSSLGLGPVIPVEGGEPAPQEEPNDTVQQDVLFKKAKLIVCHFILENYLLFLQHKLQKRKCKHLQK